jgi:O-antigen/teichoic acid export membrane protein
VSRSPANLLPDTKLLIKNTGFNAVARLITAAISFVLTPWLIRGFGEELFGAWALSLAIMGFVFMFDLGISTILTANLAKAAKNKDRREAASDIRTALVVYGVLGIVLCAVLILIAFFSHRLFALSGDAAYTLRWILIINALTQLVYWPSSIATIVLVALRRNDITASILGAQSLLGAGALLIVVLTSRGPVVLAILTGVILVAVNAVSVFFAGRTFATSFPFEETSRSMPFISASVRTLLLAALPLFAIQLTALGALDQFGKIALGVMVGGSAVAIFDIGARFSGFISQGVGLALSATLPPVSTIHEDSSAGSVRSFFLHGTRLLTICALPIIATLICLAGVLIRAWVGDGFASAILIMRILLLSQMLGMFYELGSSYLVVTRRLRYWMAVSIALALGNIALTIGLIPILGITGAAIATLIVSVLDALLLGTYIVKTLGISLRMFARRLFWPTVPALLIIPAVWLLIRPYAMSGGLVPIAVTGSALLSAFASLFFVLDRIGTDRGSIDPL